MLILGECMTRSEFRDPQKELAYRLNARRNVGFVDGVWIVESQQDAKLRGEIYFCENCKFCHTDRAYFDVDHLVPDKQFRGSANASNVDINAVILCKSLVKGDRGCNQTKGSKNWPPPGVGLAYSRAEEDMNYCPIGDRGANTVWP